MSITATLPEAVERTAQPPLAEVETLADLLERLGGVPPERVRLHPTPGTATEEDVLWLEGRADKRLCELIDGTLVEKAMGFRESRLALYLGTLLDNMVRPLNIGLVTTADGMVWMVTGRIRIPDVAFFSWDRLPGRVCPTEPIPHLAPNLAVEVLSRSNTAAEMLMKRQDYFASGVELVWQVDPVTRLVHVYTTVETFQELTAADTLDGGTVLPGFALPVAQLFGELDRHG
jgi:Uma2 family endonuclease